jgi:hypothetical protein
MSRSTKDAWLQGPGDLKEADVEDVPVKGQSVRVRGLPAAYSNQAQSEALEMKTIGSTQIATVNVAKLETIQFAHGVIEPQFTLEEAQQVAERFGPAFKKVITKIDQLSGVDPAAKEATAARFQGSGAESPRAGEAGSNGAPTGSDRPAVPARAGA